jgi:uncharacterized protein (DUF1697 family)
MTAARRHAVFLRGINVGRAKRVAMSELAELMRDAGAFEVRTLLNSGNAVCTWASTPDRLAVAVHDGIGRRLGIDVEVVARTDVEVRDVIARDALHGVATDPSRYLVAFLASAPDPTSVAALEALDVAPDRWVLDGRHLYLWLPGGSAEAPLAKHLAKGVLGVTWTSRNWSTVAKVGALL